MSKEKKKISRRQFVVRTALGGTGLLVVGAFVFKRPIRRALAEYADTVELFYTGSTDDPLIWFELTSENNVVFHCPKVEMGQGVFTGLAQIAADELEVSMEQIQVVHAASASGNLDLLSTGGSTSISSLWEPLRELAATMREMIKIAAAESWGVDVSELSVSNGIIAAGVNKTTYAEVAEGITDWTIPSTPELKPMASYKFIGRPVPRVDLIPKVYGTPIFGMDAQMPDMLYGAIVRSSKIGAKFIDADTSEAEVMPGVVQIVKEKDFVAVVAKSMYQAEVAKRMIKATWETDKDWNTEDIEAMIRVGEGHPVEIQKEGRAERILEGSDNIISAEYFSPIGAHAQLEPNGAVAHVEGDKATVIISTQVVKITRDEVAKRLGIKKKNVNIIPTYLGGGFGRRLHTPHAAEIAAISKAVGKPVKCFYDRIEEFQNDTFRPPTHHLLKAVLKENGLIEALEHNVSSGDVSYGSAITPPLVNPIMGSDLGAWRGGMIQYRGIPNYRAVSWRVKLPFATSWWRGLGLMANTFAIESFMDELAWIAEKNPVEFRLQQIQDNKRGHRLKEVIMVAAEKAKYTDTVTNGKAMGFAASTDVNTPCAQIVEVSIEEGQIKVHKVSCVMDPGIVINPNQVEAQCEGAITMGLSAALYEKMYVEKGELQPVLYGPYRMALMKDAPRIIDVTLLEHDTKPGAVGEPPLGPIGAAIANAVFRLTGKRLRRMPLQEELESLEV
ncbi:MAG: xanthine dehydrogenase family protein molybdopterin-binding subunit [Flavobacteriaceae bacterium]|nr:xanthine dehydrogenase family protein molybdopterin-binding subunit [Flavobacteriaceae bacterium]